MNIGDIFVCYWEILFFFYSHAVQKGEGERILRVVQPTICPASVLFLQVESKVRSHLLDKAMNVLCLITTIICLADSKSFQTRPSN